jgi:hypothetical protein
VISCASFYISKIKSKPKISRYYKNRRYIKGKNKRSGEERGGEK